MNTAKNSLVFFALTLLITATTLTTHAAPQVDPVGEKDPSKEMIRAAAKGDVEGVKQLLAGGANINARDGEGWTPLMHAAWNGKTVIVLNLLVGGADFQAANKTGETALIKAGQRGFTDIVQLLENAGAKKTPITLNDSGRLVPGLLPAQGWALATVAVSNQQNGFNHYVLGGEPITPTAQVNAIYGLKNWWGVTTKEETQEVLTWLLNEGHHKEYEQLASVVSHASEADYEALLQKYQSNPEVVFKLKFARENSSKLGRKSLLAWDLCRYIQVAGLAYVAGYLTEDEAWEKIMPAAKIIQETFDSWADMGDNYLTGRHYWAGERNERLDYIYSLLINQQDTHSPWNQYQWKTNLNDLPRPTEKMANKVEPRADARDVEAVPSR
jgi:uncharacterized protein DUF1266/ankyrin repeat protein